MSTSKKMNEEVKQKWINALTNGEYIQTCNRMRKEQRVKPADNVGTGALVPDMTSSDMCVMGVLADLALRESGLKPNEQNWRLFAGNNSSPTKRTLEWAGLSSYRANAMINLNDIKKKTFAEFAEYIKEKL